MKQSMMLLFICMMLGAMISRADTDGTANACQSQEAEIRRLRKQIAMIKPEIETKIGNVETYYPVYQKNILSGFVTRGQNGVRTDLSTTQTVISTKRQTGLGVMYQRNIDRNIYLGGSIDTNTNTSLNLGIGF